MFSYHPAMNHMFSGLNPPDGEVQTIRGFSAQIPIFWCVKNFMHLISFYLSLIISNYTSAKRMSYLCVRNRKDNKPFFSCTSKYCAFSFADWAEYINFETWKTRSWTKTRTKTRSTFNPQPLTPNGERMSEEGLATYPPPPPYKGDCFSLMSEGE